MTSKFDELVAKLKEIFQIDKPELDFGVYKILHARADEIEDFLTNRLKARVQATLKSHGSATAQAAFDAAKNAVVTNFGAGAIRPDGSLDSPYAASPLGQKYAEARQALAAAAGTLQNESVVYSHLLTFFGRYYEDGDFISKRRYKEGVYAIPYSGEEVKLHWANADQYYTKSGENFTNYSFTLEGGAKVRFVLVSAETAKDNVKDNDAVRRFVLFDPTKQNMEDVADSNDDGRAGAPRPPLPPVPLEETNGELSIYFQYLKVPKGKPKNAVTFAKEPTTQRDFIAAALPVIQATLNANAALAVRYAKLFQPVSKDDKRTYLEKHLTDYTEKNTRDYFIHKDLKGFLERELDFYVKSEMMHLDRIDEAETIRDLEANLRVIQAFRSIALVLIGFMAQLEEFQKKLYLKKKFVTSCEYCITMDRLSEGLRAEALANPKQQAEWKRWGIAADPKASDMLAVDARMVDTKFFVQSDGTNPFRDRLLKEIDGLDGQCDGLLIHADNFGALKLMGERYCGQIKCVYIDPPYNTGNDGFLYKDGYGHSSWLSLLDSRVVLSKPMLEKGALYFGSTDDNENCRLKAVFERAFGEDRFEAQIIVQSNKRGQTYQRIAKTHEYLLAFTTDSFSVINELPKEGTRNESDNLGSYELWELRNRNPKFNRANRPNLYYPVYVLPNTVHDGLAKVSLDKIDGAIEVVPLNSEGTASCWRWGVEKLSEAITHGYDVVVAKQKRDGGWNIYEKSRKDSSKAKTIWDETGMISEQGTTVMGDLGITEFAFPKSLALLEKICKIATDKSSTVLDYFGGSGTTAHAVIALNREDKGHRKYILVEMGDHFDTVLKPRIEKVVYSPDWKDGKPTANGKGISHCFKYLTLESYEDTLNNLELKRTGAQAQGLLQFRDDAYLLKYMLDVESRGSVISTDDFRKPFDYELKIAYESSGAAKRQKIDLVETFNYLIGLKVDQYVREAAKGYAYCDGTLPSGEHALVFWRDCEKVDAKALNAILEKLDVKTGVKAGFDVLYVNGDHAVQNSAIGGRGATALPNVIGGRGATALPDGGELKVRQIEGEFLDKMFAGEEA